MNKFPNLNRSYLDTLKAGGVSVEGFYLESDEDGFVDAPPHLKAQLAAHGFVEQERPAKDEAPAKGRK